MSTSEITLAKLIKEFDNNGQTICEKGYITEGGCERVWYMTNAQWKEFLNGMKEEAKNNFTQADGGELKESQRENKYGKYVYYPPKMASYGSSSRMMYLLFKDVPGFKFEEKLQTTMGGMSANLDGYAVRGNRHIFFEAKRLEIYKPHKKEVREAYKDLFHFLGIEILNECIKDGTFTPKYIFNNHEIIYLDVKQMISHLLGIANKFLTDFTKTKNIQKGLKIEFYYLIYNPEYVLNKSDGDLITKRQKDFIQNRYKAVQEEIQKIKFETLFENIVDYLIEKKFNKTDVKEYRDILVNSFKFICVDQNEVKSILNDEK